MQFGIALPSWIVDKQNSMWVLGAYMLAFIIILPIVVVRMNSLFICNGFITNSDMDNNAILIKETEINISL